MSHRFNLDRTSPSARFRSTIAGVGMAIAVLIAGPVPAANIDIAAFDADPIEELHRFFGASGMVDTSQIQSAKVSYINYSEGTRRVSIIRKFRGIPVIGSSYSMTVVDSTGIASNFRVEWPYIDPAFSVEPTLPTEQALSIAEDAFLQVIEDETLLGPRLRVVFPESDPTAHLVWLVDVIGVLDTTRYDPGEAVFGIVPMPPGSPSGHQFNIDAHTGYVWYRSFNQIMSAEPTAVAPQPADVPALAVYPNPFNPSTTIRFHVGAHGPVNLRVYDVTGALVRSVLFGSYSALGTHSVVWDGTDDTGRQVASGVYLVRLESPTQKVTQRATLLR
jgi:hypothetical protein